MLVQTPQQQLHTRAQRNNRPREKDNKFAKNKKCTENRTFVSYYLLEKKIRKKVLEIRDKKYYFGDPVFILDS